MICLLGLNDLPLLLTSSHPYPDIPLCLMSLTVWLLSLHPFPAVIWWVVLAKTKEHTLISLMWPWPDGQLVEVHKRILTGCSPQTNTPTLLSELNYSSPLPSISRIVMLVIVMCCDDSILILSSSLSSPISIFITIKSCTGWLPCRHVPWWPQDPTKQVIAKKYDERCARNMKSSSNTNTRFSNEKYKLNGNKYPVTPFCWVERRTFRCVFP